MIRLILSALRLTLIFIALIVPPLLLGHAQPPDSRLTTLRLTDCAPPCWIGIMPGQTTWRDAKVLFRQSYPGHMPFLIVPNDDDIGGGVRILTYHDVDEAIDTLPQIFFADWSTTQMLGNSTLMPRLSDLMRVWGLPTCVFAYAENTWAVQYNLGDGGLDTIDIMIVGVRLSPYQPIYNFRFFHLAPDAGPSCSLQPSHRWYGFAQLRFP